MNLQPDNSITALALAALGLLVASALKGFSPDVSLQLAGSAPGRIVLHCVCASRDHRFCWHWRGIQRELHPAQPAGR